VLLSYAINKADIRKRFNQGRPTFVDCGAYFAYTKGIYLDIDEYIDFVNAYNEYVSMFAQLDVIPEKTGQDVTAAETTWLNFLYMYSRVKSPHKLLPVFHAGSSLTVLVKILKFKPKIDYMALGALVGMGTNDRKNYIEKVFKIIQNSSNPTIKVHAFGMTDLRILEMFPFESADSASWKINAGNGEMLTDFGYTAVSSGKIGQPNHIFKRSKVDQEKFIRYVEAQSDEPFDILRESYKLRLL